MIWDPGRYLQFGDYRTRPAVDLLSRVTVAEPELVYDLGCGPGNSTAVLRHRWPAARIVGVDNSPEMLEEARVSGPKADWVEADIQSWEPTEPAQLVFSNSTLQWLAPHEDVMPMVASWVAPGGQLAVQMPHNHDAASHRIAAEMVDSEPWKEKLGFILRRHPVAEPPRYLAILEPVMHRVEVWEIEYHFALKGHNPVAEWVTGSLLRPLLAALEEPERSEFEAEYRRLIELAYRPRADGTTLFPFRRLFILAEA